MSSPALARVNSQDQPLYWTDDIPVCHLSAVGLSNNLIYRENAPTRREEHECEDSSFRFRPETNNEIFLYGVFDGHEGSNLSNFAAQRFPAEILLGQLCKNKLDDDEHILSVLHQAFISVEKAYVDSISDKLAERCNLLDQLPTLEGIQSQEAYDLNSDVNKRLDTLEAEIAGGTSAVIALIIKNKLYVAGVGCCRALLCKIDSDRVLRVQQLTMDHNLSNEEEVQRLNDLGLDMDKILTAGKLGKHPYTRSIGDYTIKLGYKDIEALSTASADPVIAEPELTNGIELSDNSCFLILMSSGVYKSLEDAAVSNANVWIASSVAVEFGVQSTLNGVAQVVVDKIGRLHNDAYVKAGTNSDSRRRELCSKREDMTLLVRNFNYPMPNNVGSPASSGSPVRPVTTPHSMSQTPLSITIPTGGSASEMDDHRPMFTIGSLQGIHGTARSTYSTNNLSTYTSSNDSTQSGEDSGKLFRKASHYKHPLPVDSDGKIESYVSFQGFIDALENMTDEEQAAFVVDTEPKPDYAPIPEEKEMVSPVSPQEVDLGEESSSST